MNALVFIENNRPVTDSLIVAETFGKRHDNVIRDIKELECSEEFSLLNFEESNYTATNGKRYMKYLISQDGFAYLVMGYTGKEAARFKEMYIQEFNRMREHLDKKQSGFLTELSPQLQFLIQMEQKTRQLEQRQQEQEKNFTDLKLVVDNEIWLTENQKAEIQEKVKNRCGVLQNMGYPSSFQGIYSALKTHFGVTKYDKIPRKDFEKAIDFIRGWYPKKQVK